MTHMARLSRAAWSGLVGWLAGLLASAPAMMVIGWRDSEHDPKIFFATLGFGLLAWAGWTLLLVAASWLLFVLPIALLVPPAFLLRHRARVLLLTTFLALVVVFTKMYVYQDAAASRVILRFVLYMPYGALAVFFAVTTAWWYIRGLD
jgi:hypothetical protein